MNEVKDTQSLILEIIAFIQDTPWNIKHQARLERLHDLSEMPCELAIAGKVKAGKSSFLNALLGEDLAVVGTTETTATINYFKYGIPEDPNKPVIVYWNDGRNPEPQTKAFLDSLQGHDEEVLERAEKIDHLVFLKPHPILKEITLIDTPGYGSVEEKHEQRTAGYFNPQRTAALREWQAEQSNALTETADAVIFISTPVPECSAQKFFGEYIPNISALNTLGVMTKIDQQENASVEVISRMAKTLTETFRKELSIVVPVSAGIYSAIQKLRENHKLEELQIKIRCIPEDKLLKRFKGSDTFLQEEGLYNDFYESCGLPYSVRKEMKGNMPWKVFYTIAIALYYNTIEEAEKYLIEYSGMEQVKAILEKQFFSRAKAIRCVRVLREVQQILVYIQNVGLPVLRSQIKSRTEFLAVIDYSRNHFNVNMLNAFENFVKINIPDAQLCDRYQEVLASLLVKVDVLLQQMANTERITEGLHLLDKCSHLLRSKDEVEELELLFGKYPDKTVSPNKEYCLKRQRFWSARAQRIKENKDFAKLLALVYAAYGNLLNDEK